MSLWALASKEFTFPTPYGGIPGLLLGPCAALLGLWGGAHRPSSRTALRGAALVAVVPARGEEAARAVLSRAPCVPQALRDQVRRMPAGHPAHTGGAPRPGLRVPPALLCLRRLQAAAGHGRRVLPHGGQPAGVQGGLRDGQAARSAGGVWRTPYSSANGFKASPGGARRYPRLQGPPRSAHCPARA